MGQFIAVIWSGACDKLQGKGGQGTRNRCNLLSLYLVPPPGQEAGLGDDGPDLQVKAQRRACEKAPAHGDAPTAGEATQHSTDLLTDTSHPRARTNPTRTQERTKTQQRRRHTTKTPNRTSTPHRRPHTTTTWPTTRPALRGRDCPKGRLAKLRRLTKCSVGPPLGQGGQSATQCSPLLTCAARKSPSSSKE